MLRLHFSYTVNGTRYHAVSRYYGKVVKGRGLFVLIEKTFCEDDYTSVKKLYPVGSEVTIKVSKTKPAEIIFRAPFPIVLGAKQLLSKLSSLTT